MKSARGVSAMPESETARLQSLVARIGRQDGAALAMPTARVRGLQPKTESLPRQPPFVHLGR